MYVYVDVYKYRKTTVICQILFHELDSFLPRFTSINRCDKNEEKKDVGVVKSCIKYRKKCDLIFDDLLTSIV